MSQEAKVIALEHLVITLIKELKVSQEIQPEIVYEQALYSIMSGRYPAEQEKKTAAAGALQDVVALIS
ncbi:hypothetical protein [Pseudomonas syringae]|nr:hypothetical protein [Pseudomonas syringae]MCF5225751.1 hypothetical protein [Pseudomonas syringae]MCF5244482.1 hypothetical protein [Pseudomonas syringae]